MEWVLFTRMPWINLLHILLLISSHIHRWKDLEYSKIQKIRNQAEYSTYGVFSVPLTIGKVKLNILHHSLQQMKGTLVSALPIHGSL